MSVETASYINTREETVRTERVSKTTLSSVSLSLAIGGEAVFEEVLEDVEEYVGPIDKNNEYKVTEHASYYLIKVYREQNVCEVGDCHTTASHKFDGTWLCDNHVDSYTARYI
jgi:hypothetical protein